MTGRTRPYAILLVMIVTVLLTLSGCSNPYLNPDTAAALSDQAVEREIVKLNANVERQNVLLERIARATEKQAGIAHAEAGWSK